MWLERKKTMFQIFSKILRISKFPWEVKILDVKFNLLMLALDNYKRKIYLMASKKNPYNLRKHLNLRPDI